MRLTRAPADDVSPAWGPGNRIAFESDRSGDSEIWTIGGGRHRGQAGHPAGGSGVDADTRSAMTQCRGTPLAERLATIVATAPARP